jgi:putative endonuclease
MKGFVVYILRTSGNTLYTGQTNDLEKRLEQHRKGKVGAKYLRMFTSFKLVYSEKVASLSEALKRESEVKRMSKSAKEDLVKLANDKN